LTEWCGVAAGGIMTGGKVAIGAALDFCCGRIRISLIQNLD